MAFEAEDSRPEHVAFENVFVLQNVDQIEPAFHDSAHPILRHVHHACLALRAMPPVLHASLAPTIHYSSQLLLQKVLLADRCYLSALLLVCLGLEESDQALFEQVAPATLVDDFVLEVESAPVAEHSCHEFFAAAFVAELQDLTATTLLKHVPSQRRHYSSQRKPVCMPLQ